MYLTHLSSGTCNHCESSAHLGVVICNTGKSLTKIIFYDRSCLGLAGNLTDILLKFWISDNTTQFFEHKYKERFPLCTYTEAQGITIISWEYFSGYTQAFSILLVFCCKTLSLVQVVFLNYYFFPARLDIHCPISLIS